MKGPEFPEIRSQSYRNPHGWNATALYELRRDQTAKRHHANEYSCQNETHAGADDEPRYRSIPHPEQPSVDSSLVDADVVSSFGKEEATCSRYQKRPYQVHERIPCEETSAVPSAGRHKDDEHHNPHCDYNYLYRSPDTPEHHFELFDFEGRDGPASGIGFGAQSGVCRIGIPNWMNSSAAPGVLYPPPYEENFPS